MSVYHGLQAPTQDCIIGIVEAPPMNEVVLHYFQGKGLGEQVRLMLWEAGVKYQEQYIDTREKLEALRQNNYLLFQQLPLLEIDGLKLVQSSAIVRYIARRYNLYGKNLLDQIHCDMLADGIKDLLKKMVGYPYQTDKESWRVQVSPLIPQYFSSFTAYLSRNNDQELKGFLLGDTITYVDITLFDVLKWINEIFPDLIADYPFIYAFYTRMLSRDSIKTYYSQRVLLTGDNYVQQVKNVLTPLEITY